MIGGLLFSTKTSTLIWHYKGNDYWVKIFKTKNGHYFRVQKLPQCMPNSFIEPMSETWAVDKYMGNKKYAQVPFEVAFPEFELKEA